ISYLKERFKEMDKEVTITLFVSDNCDLCKEDIELLKELSSIDERIKLDIVDIEKDNKKAQLLGIKNAPAIVLTGDYTYPIYYLGSPIGYEFSALIEDIINISKRNSELSNEIKQKLKSINQNVEIKVFVTPSCPYCPGMVHTAHLFSIENNKIVSKMIECGENSEECEKYEVAAVPTVVINDKVRFEGLVSPNILLQRVQESIK
ncbi:MAG: thioredoxin family protein, partial [Candidatus Rehaiarchaeum fermentans]|nr:thioredoxin family protein [Candidatus Rehaiarchaeum fermentans]